MSSYYKQTQATISMAIRARREREAAARSDAWNRYLAQQASAQKPGVGDVLVTVAFAAMAVYGLIGGGWL